MFHQKGNNSSSIIQTCICKFRYAVVCFGHILSLTPFSSHTYIRSLFDEPQPKPRVASLWLPLLASPLDSLLASFVALQVCRGTGEAR